MALNVRALTRIGILLALTLAIQMLRLPQPITGPLVNAMLVLAAVMVGVLGGVIIGVLTPWIALANGILSPVLAPAIPFIMAGNAALVLVFGAAARVGAHCGRRFERVSQVGGVLVGGFVKYLVIAGAVRLLVDVPAAVALQLPQLFTAWAGGVLALGVMWGAGFLRGMAR
ncbi:MAG: ECF transporter S component [bacterium]|nr:ECF transporter S component [bacterium]